MAPGLLPRLVALMDRRLMPGADALSLGPVCVEVEARLSGAEITLDEARTIMAEIDAKAAALLAVLAILLAASAFLFSLSETWLALILMFSQVAVISVSILYLLRCLIYEPSPRLRHLFEMEGVAEEFHLQIEAIKQVRYFNRTVVQTAVTAALFFVMALQVGVETLLARG
ncbi:hypothetical protein [Histidinibacterium lentulum]|uniref:Uncharacterized protein n=1 Tax=Histidinibacterium lentulum TaxID=2480588 RepID=A0A3N2QVY6_9RHOB|nr:hypothetical protein [Histidinibacterium lentulum]ROT99401.1 hypothetical protein EAT49_14375 [Histidinibacterium lentulum]